MREKLPFSRENVSVVSINDSRKELSTSEDLYNHLNNISSKLCQYDSLSVRINELEKDMGLVKVLTKTLIGTINKYVINPKR